MSVFAYTALGHGRAADQRGRCRPTTRSAAITAGDVRRGLHRRSASTNKMATAPRRRRSSTGPMRQPGSRPARRPSNRSRANWPTCCAGGVPLAGRCSLLQARSLQPRRQAALERDPRRRRRRRTRWPTRWPSGPGASRASTSRWSAPARPAGSSTSCSRRSPTSAPASRTSRARSRPRWSTRSCWPCLAVGVLIFLLTFFIPQFSDDLHRSSAATCRPDAGHHRRQQHGEALRPVRGDRRCWSSRCVRQARLTTDAGRRGVERTVLGIAGARAA